ncbi:MAG: glycosyltransferase, partial [Campylobacterales bacterium]|nr:glycosyltransferase [Campylobacterales bacterium]
EAARAIKQRHPHVEFCLLGFLDPQNPKAISSEQMDAWMKEGVVNYLGESDRVDEVIATADCVVLPSYYREGTPRTLLESASMGKPIITTDNVGCRDVVDDGVNGFLCQKKDAVDLEHKLEMMLMLTVEERKKMGEKGREKILKEFDEKIVFDKYKEAIGEIVL